MNSVLQIKSMTNNSFESTNIVFDEFRLSTLNYFHKPWIGLQWFHKTSPKWLTFKNCG